MSNIPTKNEKNSEGEISEKVIGPDEQAEIIQCAVKAVLENFSKVAAAKATNAKLDGGQLRVLINALKDYPEPVTEEAWDAMFKANVTELLAGAKINGKSPYANDASRDVMVYRFKVATMGLTLTKQDGRFAPSKRAMNNLKKYVDEVRPKLQAAIDPATNKPRFQGNSASGNHRRPKRLAAGAHYWLIGCVDAEKGLKGANTVVGYGDDLRKLEIAALRLETEGKFKSFLYCEAKMEPLAPEPAEDDLGSVIQNTTVMSSTLQAA